MLAGVSGGPDSTALLSVLASLVTDIGFTLLACDVENGIRPPAEREADRAAVQALCAGFGVPLDVRTIPEGGCEREAREGGRSLEDVARRRRLEALAGAADAAGAGFIALGHTRDDHRETVLMRALQGAGARGLGGIAAQRGRFVRPLLAASRAEVTAHLAAGGHLDQDGRQLQQRVGRCVEAARFDVDHDRQEAAEAVPDTVAGLGCAHPVTSFQAIVPPARSGTSSSAPNG